MHGPVWIQPRNRRHRKYPSGPSGFADPGSGSQPDHQRWRWNSTVDHCRGADARAERRPPSGRVRAGIASTYGEGDGFEGNRTACGQIFHTSVVQIAHKTLPCGTVVRVEDPDTAITVDAEVTDRGPYVAGRIVDLSWAAFKQLDPSGPGLLHVNVYVLNQ